MTREEAIYRLKNMAWLYGSAEREQNIEAIDMAIEALQREEAEEKGYCHRIKPKEYFSTDADRPKVIGIDYSPYRIQTTAPSAEQVTSTLNNPCNSLLTDESNGSKEHKSKLDLISRQDVIEALSRSSVYAWSIEQDQTAHNWALNIIKALPSADADVVRCKDCKYSFYDKDYESYNCRKHEYVELFDADDYCSWGERND